jgi:hypothetical protein
MSVRKGGQSLTQNVLNELGGSMKKVFGLLLLLTLSISVALPALVHSQNPDPGPPQFLTRPILLHVSDRALDNGHAIFEEGPGESAIPGPLVPNLGTAAYNPAALATLLISAGADRDVSDSADSYEGETGATGTGSILVGASNHIYPGNCVAAAPTGTFGDCAVKAYASTNGGSSFTGTAISRTWGGNTFGITFDPGVD